MIKNYTLALDSFFLPTELSEFFERKKISVHYRVDWNLIDNLVKPTNISIQEVHNISRSDVGIYTVKTLWQRDELTENVYNLLMVLVEKDAEIMDKNFVPLAEEFPEFIPPSMPE